MPRRLPLRWVKAAKKAAEAKLKLTKATEAKPAAAKLAVTEVKPAALKAAKPIIIKSKICDCDDDS
jgi:hypothetical protein